MHAGRDVVFQDLLLLLQRRARPQRHDGAERLIMISTLLNLLLLLNLSLSQNKRSGAAASSSAQNKFAEK